MNLTPVDFKAVAAKGAYVYCYLREHDRTPYYVGISKRSVRPTEQHKGQHLPVYDALIRVLKSGLTEKEAKEYERFYIARYGRKDTTGGLLRNRTNGGDGIDADSWSDKAKSLQAQKTAFYYASLSDDEKQDRADAIADTHIHNRAVQLGVDPVAYKQLTQDQRDNLSHIIRRGSTVERAWQIVTVGFTPDMRAPQVQKIADSKKVKAAKKFGVPIDIYMAMERQERMRLGKRFSRGIRGPELWDSKSRYQAAA